MPQIITATAPAKIIIFGEHAVVYGKPALAVPLTSLHAKVTVTSDKDQLTIYAQNTHELLHWDKDTSHPLMMAVRLILEHLQKQPPAIHLIIDSQIPIASGLGSGAAVSTAIVKSVAQYFQQSLELEYLNNIVYEIEKLHHGTPSGIDNTVIVYNQPVLFKKNQPLEFMNIGTPLHLIIADTGIPASTRISVGDVRKLYENNPSEVQHTLNEIEAIVLQARAALEQGDLYTTGSLMVKNHEYLQKLTVSSPELDQLVTTAMKAGALGAKLSGGGRGGNMIALVEENTSYGVQRALENAGAASIIRTLVDLNRGNNP